MNKSLFKAIFWVIGCVVLSGCNIFSWSHKDSVSSNDTTELVSNAESSISNNDYVKAMEYYERAVEIEPANSKARYGYVSAYVKNSGLNIILDIPGTNINIINQKSSQGKLTPGLFARSSRKSYFLFDNNGIDIKKYEDLAIVVIKYLDPIAKNQCDGKISSNDSEVNLNLAFAYLLRGIFLIIDPSSGDSGEIQYNIICNDDGTYAVWSYKTNSELPTSAVLSKKGDALDYLDTAILRLNTAITYSAAKNSKNWTEVKKILQDIRTKISSYKG